MKWKAMAGEEGGEIEEAESEGVVEWAPFEDARQLSPG